MRIIVAGLAMLAAAAPAIACQCIPLRTAAEKREMAARIAKEAVAVADVEMVSPMDRAAGRGEVLRVLKVHVGRVPAQFTVDRGISLGGQIVMTTCEIVPVSSQRMTVVIYPGSDGRFQIGALCAHDFVNSPGGIELIRTEKAKLARTR